MHRLYKLFIQLLILKSTILFHPEIVHSLDMPGSEKSPAYYYQKGLLQFNNEMYDYSIESMLSALEKNSSHYNAANILGKIYIIKNDRQRGVKYFNISLGINSEQPDIHCSLGELYEFFSETELAFGHFLEAVKIEPGHFKSNLNLVRFYLTKKDKISADRHFKVSYEAGYGKSKDAYEKAKKLYRLKNFDKAAEILDGCIKENPSLIEAYIDIYNIYRETGKYEKAAESMEKLKFIKPDFERAYINLGHIYFTKKFPGKKKFYLDKAINNLTKALQLNPDNYETYYLLSHVYYAIGNYDKGKEYEKTAEGFENIKRDKPDK